MNPEDRRIAEDERDASPERSASARRGIEEVEPTLLPENAEISKSLSRQDTRSSRASTEPVRHRSTGISRISTQHDDIGLERHPTALSRIQTGRSQHSHTIAQGLRSRTSLRHSKTPLPNFGAGKPFPPNLPDREDYVVEFDGPKDPLHPQNWPLKKKIPIAAILAFVTLVASFGSSIFSAAIGSVAQEFHFSREVGTLGTSLYVLGFATGPILWAPYSELYGRRQPITIAAFGIGVFNIGVAVAKDAQTVFICRFFGGFFGASPLTNVGAVMADMFNNRQRGLAITVFAMTVFTGPLFAPFIGAFIDISYLGWRWTEYLPAIMGFFSLVLCLLFIEETYPPIVLVNKAADLRRRTKNWGIHAKQEEIEIDFHELLEKNLSRPMRMLFTEPIVLLLSIYMAFIYGLLYLFLTFYPIVFQGVYGFNEGVGGLPFLGMIIGQLGAGTYMVLIQPSYQRKLQANNNVPIPEWRLLPVIVGGVTFAAGLFWFGWSGWNPSIPWIVPTLSGLFTGFGIMCIFLQCLNYLIDAYLMFAASAIAANTFLRSLAGAGFPLFATQMIEGLGVQWAGTLLGCLAVLGVPIPVIFYLKGAKIRERSTFAPTFSTANHGNDSPVENDPEKDEAEK